MLAPQEFPLHSVLYTQTKPPNKAAFFLHIFNSLKYLLPADEADEHENDSDDQKDMDKATDGVSGHKAQKPQDQ